LKPRDDRAATASDIIVRLQPKLAQVKDITLYMQPVQDLTVEDRVSRTQFQYTLEDPNATELNTLSNQLVDKLRTLPELRDVASDQQNGGQQTEVVIDRDTASRLGIPIATIDNTLEDAFAQRQVSTIFTQLNQYHVVLEVDPQFEQNPGSLKDLYVASGNKYRSAAFRLHPGADFRTPLWPSITGTVSGGDIVVQSGAGKVSGRRHQGHQQGRKRDRLSGERKHQFSGNGGGLSEFARQ